MQTMKPKCGIFGMANSRDMSGWVTAELVKPRLATGKEKKPLAHLWRSP